MDQRRELRELIEKNLEPALAKQMEASGVLARASEIVGRGSSPTTASPADEHHPRDR